MRFFFFIGALVSIAGCSGSDAFFPAGGDDSGVETGASSHNTDAATNADHSLSAVDTGSDASGGSSDSSIQTPADSNASEASVADRATSIPDASAADGTGADVTFAVAETGPDGEGGGTIATDAGSDVDGGGGSDGSTPIPGFIACGASTCDERTQFCCVTTSGAESCQTTDAACMMLGGARRDCDKASDCSAGNVCCFDFSSIPATAGCRGDCTGGGGTRVQACRTQSECLAGTCAVHSCTVGGSIQSCEPFAPDCP